MPKGKFKAEMLPGEWVVKPPDTANYGTLLYKENETYIIGLVPYWWGYNSTDGYITHGARKARISVCTSGKPGESYWGNPVSERKTKDIYDLPRSIRQLTRWAEAQFITGAYESW